MDRDRAGRHQRGGAVLRCRSPHGRSGHPAADRASQGSHVVLEASFLGGSDALLVPETPDGRVLFAIPWHGHALIGTTDIAIPDTPAEPVPQSEEIDFILETVGRYLTRQPTRHDVLSTFAGIRPLIRADGAKTSKLSRDFAIRVDAPGLLTITGGKWTTYRSMAEACVDQAAELAGLPRKACRTADLRIHSEAHSSTEVLHPALPYGVNDALHAVRAEMGARLKMY